MLLVLGGVVGTLIFLAHFAGTARLYVGPEWHALPRSLVPESAYSFASELRGSALTRMAVPRVGYVYRGFTPYSHAQLLITLLSSLALSAAVVALSFGRRAEHELCSLTVHDW